MKKTLMILTAMSIFAAPAAHAGFYGSVGLGANLYGIMDWDDDSSSTDLKFTFPAYSLAVGYELPFYNIRAEVEYMNLSAKVKEASEIQSKVSAMMLNAYVPIPVPILTPYIGAGVGVARGEYYIDPMKAGFNGGNEFAWQIMLGAEIDVPFISTVGVELRYVNSKAAQEDFIIGSDWTNHNLALFLKARF